MHDVFLVRANDWVKCPFTGKMRRILHTIDKHEMSPTSIFGYLKKLNRTYPPNGVGPFSERWDGEKKVVTEDMGFIMERAKHLGVTRFFFRRKKKSSATSGGIMRVWESGASGTLHNCSRCGLICASTLKGLMIHVAGGVAKVSKVPGNHVVLCEKCFDKEVDNERTRD